MKSKVKPGSEEIKAFVGKKGYISEIKELEMDNSPVKVLKMITNVLGQVDGEDIRADVMFNDYGKYNKGKLAEFMQKYGVKKPIELLGRQVVIYMKKNGWLGHR